MLHLEGSLRRLIDAGMSFDCALDVGANRGQWFRVFSSVFPRSEVLSVEANPLCFSHLLLVNPNCLNALFSSSTGEEFDFFLPDPYSGASDTGASIYRENQKHYDKPQVLKLSSRTIDELGRKFDYIKLDTQGSELDILRGGTQTIPFAKVIEIELSLLRYNDGAPLIAEVVSFLHSEFSFRLFDISELMSFQGRLLQINAIFLNPQFDSLLDVPV